MLMMIARGISTAPHEKFIIQSFLSIMSCHIAFSLLANHITDDTFFTLKVITYGISFIRSFSVFKHRSTFNSTQRILYPMSIDCTAIHIHSNYISRQFNRF
ncbi:hypothetical protein EVA_03936 [gut metagenome]|uniref:Uncharacterized protein n=1 Tax=gut metagenome TaxID=749906 RepID=J9GXV1_9ZZZZ